MPRLHLDKRKSDTARGGDDPWLVDIMKNDNVRPLSIRLICKIRKWTHTYERT